MQLGALWGGVVRLLGDVYCVRRLKRWHEKTSHVTSLGSNLDILWSVWAAAWHVYADIEQCCVTDHDSGAWESMRPLWACTVLGGPPVITKKNKCKAAWNGGTGELS